MATKHEIVWDALKKYGSLTSLEIIQLVYTTCPHSIIRDLRKKYGYDRIDDTWINKTKEVEVRGKTVKMPVRYKKYFYWEEE